MSIIEQRIADLAPARSFPVKPLPAEYLSSGLVVRSPNWLGDAVMTLPALAAVAKLLPDQAPLAVIAPAGVAELYRLLPAVTHIITLPEAHEHWSQNVFKVLNAFHFRVGILFNNSLRDAWQMRQAGISKLYGRAARCRSLLMARAFRFPRWKKGMLNESHHANEYLSMVMALGAQPLHPLMPALISKRRMDQLSLEIQGFCQHPKLLILAPGAAYGAAKRWSSENFRAVAQWYLAKGGIAVIVGSASEARIGNEVAAGLPPNRIFNLAGRTNFTDLYQLLKSARACVANDSGIMHLAAALGTPGVAVFGSTDYRATGPVSDRWLLVFDKEKCAPCFERVCPRQHRRCMTKLEAPEVAEALDRVLKRS